MSLCKIQTTLTKKIYPLQQPIKHKDMKKKSNNQIYFVIFFYSIKVYINHNGIISNFVKNNY